MHICQAGGMPVFLLALSKAVMGTHKVAVNESSMHRVHVVLNAPNDPLAQDLRLYMTCPRGLPP
jgi:hypothetical protein